MPTSKISFGCPMLDEYFGGGISLRIVTEVVGESGSGKTQLGMQLALNAQIPRHMGGLEGTSLYFYTDFAFPIRRLHELALQKTFLGPKPLDKVFVHSIQTCDHLLSLLGRLDATLQSSNVKLIVIDSIATLFRGNFNPTGQDMSVRQKLFFKISSRLRTVAHKYDLAVLITNQVVDSIPGSSNIRIGNEPTLYSSGRLIEAALGLAWANCVNTRLAILLQRKPTDEGGCHDEDESAARSPTIRILTVVFAPNLGPTRCGVVIQREGFFAL